MLANRHHLGLRFRASTVLSMVLLLCAAHRTQAAPQNSADEAAVRRADQAFVAAIDKGNKRQLEPLIATGFSWTNAAGQTLDRGNFLKVPAQDAPADSPATLHDYGDVVFLTGAGRIRGEQVRLVRVWVREADGWRILLVQQTKIEGEKRPAQATVAAGTACENPCRSVPYRPQTAAQRQVVESWQQLETAVNQRNADEWARHVADEFVFNVKENGNPLTKADRVATIRRQARGEKVTDIGAVVPGSMDVRVFGSTAVMRDTQQPTTHARPYRALRLWVKRDERWQLVYSQQTTIQP